MIAVPSPRQALRSAADCSLPSRSGWRDGGWCRRSALVGLVVPGLAAMYVAQGDRVAVDVVAMFALQHNIGMGVGALGLLLPRSDGVGFSAVFKTNRVIVLKALFIALGVSRPA